MCHEAACPEQGIRRRMESHLEFEVYGLILYLAFLFAKEGFSDWIFFNHFNKNVRFADSFITGAMPEYHLFPSERDVTARL